MKPYILHPTVFILILENIVTELTRAALMQVPEALKAEAERLFHNNDLFWLLYADSEDTNEQVKLYYAGRAVRPLFNSGLEAIEYAISGVNGKVHVDYTDASPHGTRELGNQRNYGNHFNNTK